MQDLKDTAISRITMKCLSFLDADTVKKVERAVVMILNDYDISAAENAISTYVEIPNEKYINQFIAIKTVNGCSEGTINYYRLILDKFFKIVDKNVPDVSTNDIRFYLANLQMSGASSVTLDNERRIFNSFFGTLRREEILDRDPCEKISKIKGAKIIKKPFTDMELEKLREVASTDLRLCAIVEFLASTGCRVSEASGTNRTDIHDDTLIVTGKGNKQRYVYLTARAQLALKNYFDSRTDDDEALFVGKRQNSTKCFQRLAKGRIEQLIRELGKKANVENCHPHRFRRTMATQALRNGMPIEQVSHLLGHDQISTTQIYAKSDEADVHAAHHKYLGR